MRERSMERTLLLYFPSPLGRPDTQARQPLILLSAVLIVLLELPADSKNHHLTFRKGLPLSPSADTHRSARHALSLIATARSSVFIATIYCKGGKKIIIQLPVAGFKVILGQVLVRYGSFLIGQVACLKAIC